MNEYWDTSAIIPCLVYESATDRVRTWLRNQTESVRFTSWLTIFEFETVIKRKLNKSLITQKEYELIQKQWADFQSTFNFIPVDNRVARLGTRLQKLYGILTGDSVQLGSASLLQLEYNQLMFVCLDNKLVNLAKQEGLTSPEFGYFRNAPQ